MGTPLISGTCASENSPKVTVNATKVTIQYDELVSIDRGQRNTCYVHIPAHWTGGYHVVIRRIKLKGANDLAADANAKLLISLSMPWSKVNGRKLPKLPTEAQRNTLYSFPIDSSTKGQFEKEVDGVNLYSACGAEGFLRFGAVLHSSYSDRPLSGSTRLDSFDVELELVPCID